ncbi:MAG: PaaX family transcriptional regulator C-terminal domain-containing protein [Pseudomonadota bacterium]
MTSPLPQIVQDVTGGHAPRVWSLLVTIFGDLALGDGAEISGQALGPLTDAIGIKPEAVRTALHRLRKDGWIESERRGRHSVHRLSPWGRAQSRAASPRIYGAEPLAQRAFVVVHDRPPEGASRDGAWVAPTICIASQPSLSADVFTAEVTVDQTLPRWMSAKLCPVPLVAQAAALERGLARCTARLDAMPLVARHDVAVLRVLVVHEWRRIVLRLPDLPDRVFPPDWAGPACRAHVAALLARHPRVTLAEDATG